MHSVHIDHSLGAQAAHLDVGRPKMATTTMVRRWWGWRLTRATTAGMSLMVPQELAAPPTATTCRGVKVQVSVKMQFHLCTGVKKGFQVTKVQLAA